jgi:hypothetical protein
MPLHLQKLCVGAESFEDLEEWIAQTLEEKRSRGLAVEQVHTTRMAPGRAGDLLDGGSLYWVIKGVMQARQRLLALRSVTGADGISRCQLVLDPELVRVVPRPSRPFQGWRYLAHADAPSDMRDATKDAGLPAHIVVELKELGLL